MQLMKIKSLRPVKMVQWVTSLAAMANNVVLIPGPAGWKKRTDSWKLSSG